MDKIPSIEELKVIIHGLRMSTLVSVEVGAIDEVQHMIQALPLPEELDRLDNPMLIKKIRKDVGSIMRIVELYGKRDKEYKVRYKSRTGLPPRYKILEWRSAMKKAEFIKEMIKVSSVADDKGNADVATKLMLFAKNVQEGKVEEQDVDDAIITLKSAGFDKEARMIREAGWMSNMWEGAKSVGKGVAEDVGQAAQGVGQAAKDYGQKQVGRFNEGIHQGKIGEVQKDMENIIKLIQDAQNKVTAVGDPSLNALKDQLRYMYGIAAQEWQVIEEIETSGTSAPKVPATKAPAAPTPEPEPESMVEYDAAEGTTYQPEPEVSKKEIKGPRRILLPSWGKTKANPKSKGLDVYVVQLGDGTLLLQPYNPNLRPEEIVVKPTDPSYGQYLEMAKKGKPAKHKRTLTKSETSFVFNLRKYSSQL